jgi:hypothetical protein
MRNDRGKSELQQHQYDDELKKYRILSTSKMTDFRVDTVPIDNRSDLRVISFL